MAIYTSLSQVPYTYPNGTEIPLATRKAMVTAPVRTSSTPTASSSVSWNSTPVTRTPTSQSIIPTGATGQTYQPTSSSSYQPTSQASQPVYTAQNTGTQRIGNYTVQRTSDGKNYQVRGPTGQVLMSSPNEATALAGANGYNSMSQEKQISLGLIPAQGTSAIINPGKVVLGLIAKAASNGNLNVRSVGGYGSGDYVKAERYLSQAFSSPETVAQFLVDTGVQNYQNQPWWTSLPEATRTQAYTIASQMPKTTQTQISTGNAELDQQANSILDAIWEEYKAVYGNSPQGVTAETLAALASKVDAKYGSEFARLRKQAEDTYNASYAYTKGSYDLNKQQLETSKTRADTDVATGLGQIREDEAKNKRILGRNYQQATEDSARAYQAANRTFSGQRDVDAGKITTAYEEDLNDVTTQASRNSQALSLSGQRLKEDADASQRQLELSNIYNMFGLDQNKAASLQDVNDYRSNIITGEEANLRAAYDSYMNAIMNMTGAGSYQNTPTQTTVQAPTVSTVTPSTTGSVAWDSTRTVATPPTIATPTRTLTASAAPTASYSNNAEKMFVNPAITAARKLKGYTTAKASTRF